MKGRCSSAAGKGCWAEARPAAARASPGRQETGRRVISLEEVGRGKRDLRLRERGNFLGGLTEVQVGGRRGATWGPRGSHFTRRHGRIGRSPTARIGGEGCASGGGIHFQRGGGFRETRRHGNYPPRFLSPDHFLVLPPSIFLSGFALISTFRSYFKKSFSAPLFLRS